MATHKGIAGTGLPQQDKPWREKCPNIGAYRWLDEAGRLKVLDTTTGGLRTMEQLYNLHSRLMFGNDGTASEIFNSWVTEPDRFGDDWELHAHEEGLIDFYCRACDIAFHDKRRGYDTDMNAFVARCPDCDGFAPYIPPAAREHAGGVGVWLAQHDKAQQAKRRDTQERRNAAAIRDARNMVTRKRREVEEASTAKRRTKKATRRRAAGEQEAYPAVNARGPAAKRRKAEAAPAPTRRRAGTQAPVHNTRRRAISHMAHNGSMAEPNGIQHDKHVLERTGSMVTSVTGDRRKNRSPQKAVRRQAKQSALPGGTKATRKAAAHRRPRG